MAQGSTAAAAAVPEDAPTTLRDIRRWVREGQKFAMLTCYDATTARWLYRGGLRTMLVGDSAAEMVLGFQQTIHAPLDFLITLTAAVKRGAPKAFVVGDMPFMSYQADDAEAVRNAGRFMLEGMADAVKLEVDEQYVDLIGKLARASIPVVAHIGWRPQRLQQTGVPQVAGRTQKKIEELVELAQVMEQRGAAMLLIEASTAEAAKQIIEKVSIPVVGCGAGPHCHGHVLILQDWLGLTDWQPSFARPTDQGGQWLMERTRRWVDHVAKGEYLQDGGPYRMNT